jgi:8-amino-7-oxononanoate synthase
MESPPGPEIRLGERTLLYFGGTAYHALQGHPELLDAAAVAMQRYGMGTATAGTWPIAPSPVQRELELEAAAYFGTQDAVALASGYMTTWVALAGLEGRFERCFVDQNSHYAVLDALRLMGIEAVRYAHDDVDELASLLRAELRGQASRTERPLIVSDGVFPTFGRVAQLGRLAELAAEFGGLLWVDDAHGVGVLGEHGRGSSELAGLEIGEHVFVGASLAKAIGAHGGIVPGPAEFCARIRERSRLLSASMAISVPNAAAATAGLRILQREPGWRVELLENNALAQGRAALPRARAARDSASGHGLLAWDRVCESTRARGDADARTARASGQLRRGRERWRAAHRALLAAPKGSGRAARERARRGDCSSWRAAR